MKTFKWLLVVIGAYIVVFASGYESRRSRNIPLTQNSFSASPVTLDRVDGENINPASASRYQLEPARSKFIAHALAGGLLWFKGHDHLIAVPDFTGEASLDPSSIGNSSLQITAKSASMHETSSVFTDTQKKIIDKELREIVLLPAQHPEIVFRSTAVTGKSIANNDYDLKIAGNLTLNGVTRPVTIPTKVTVSGSDLRAQGEFSINRSDFNVKATSAFHGLVRVRDRVKFEFDITARRF